MIAEIVSLSGYEAQVSMLLSEEERMAMEFYIACTPEDHPIMPGSGGSARRAGHDGVRAKAVAFVPCISFWRDQAESIWLGCMPSRKSRHFPLLIRKPSPNWRH